MIYEYSGVVKKLMRRRFLGYVAAETDELAWQKVNVKLVENYCYTGEVTAVEIKLLTEDQVIERLSFVGC